jgi:SAM-dependent methyltransferase
MKSGPATTAWREQDTLPAPATDERTAKGAALYSRRVLFFYDFFVVWFSSRFAWKCPAARILSLYNEHLASPHLEVGVGTGYFLDRCRCPAGLELTLADLNPGPLDVAARRLARLQPRTCRINVLEPLPLAGPGFASIGLNHVLHCLPGTMAEKAAAIRNLKAVLRPGGVLFGATVLGQGVPRNGLARFLMRLYNARGVFSNGQDNPKALEALLQANFASHQLEFRGCVALFMGRT